MWLGVLLHVVGEHEWSDGEYSHGPLSAFEPSKPLLEKASKAMEAPTKVIFDTYPEGMFIAVTLLCRVPKSDS